MDWTELVLELVLMPLVAFVVGMAMVLMMRKIAAKLQRRVGPPLFQPLYDIVKLHSKETQVSHGLIHEIGIVMAIGGYVAAETLLPGPRHERDRRPGWAHRAALHDHDPVPGPGPGGGPVRQPQWLHRYLPGPDRYARL